MRRGFLAGLAKRLPRPTPVAILIVWLTYMVPATFVLAVDPYELYPWGVRITPATRHDALHANRVFGIAAADRDADTLLIGSSVSARIELDDIRAMVPGARTVWNLSYPGVAPRDRQIVLDWIEARSHAHTILVTLDFILASSIERPSYGFPIDSYDGDFTNDLRVVDSRTLREARDALLRGSPFPDRSTSDEVLRTWRKSAGFHSPEGLALIARSLREQRATIDAGHDKPCSAFPHLPRFEASIRRLAAQGRRVHLIVPVYSPSFYYQYRIGAAMPKALRETLLGDQIAMRRCVTRALGDTPNITISALDRDTALSNSLANFMDPGHLALRANFRRQLAAISDPRYRLTPANIDAYVERYRQNVKNYCPGGVPAKC